MNYQDKINEIDSILKSLKNFKSELTKINKLSERCCNTSFENSTPKQIQNINANLNFSCMHLDKQHKRVWKEIKESFLETDTEDREYSPSGFHTYK